MSLLQTPAKPPSLAENLLRSLVEYGLVHRPIFVWLGPSTPARCVSPYADDLADLIFAWATGPGRNAVSDLFEHVPPGTDAASTPRALRTALAVRFCEQSPALAREQRTIEARMGILQVGASTTRGTADIVDLQRLGPDSLARMGWPQDLQPTGVIICLPWQPEMTTSEILPLADVVECTAALMHKPVTRLRQITAVSTATNELADSENPVGRMQEALAQQGLTSKHICWLELFGQEEAMTWLFAESRRWLWHSHQSSAKPRV